jgi:hypothetical protein
MTTHAWALALSVLLPAGTPARADIITLNTTGRMIGLVPFTPAVTAGRPTSEALRRDAVDDRPRHRSVLLVTGPRSPGWRFPRR